MFSGFDAAYLAFAVLMAVVLLVAYAWRSAWHADSPGRPPFSGRPYFEARLLTAGVALVVAAAGFAYLLFEELVPHADMVARANFVLLDLLTLGAVFAVLWSATDRFG